MLWSSRKFFWRPRLLTSAAPKGATFSPRSPRKSVDRYATRNGLDRRDELDLAHSFPPNCCGRRDKLPRSTVPGFVSRKGRLPIDLVTSLVRLQGENFSLTSDRK